MAGHLAQHDRVDVTAVSGEASELLAGRNVPYSGSAIFGSGCGYGSVVETCERDCPDIATVPGKLDKKWPTGWPVVRSHR